MTSWHRNRKPDEVPTPVAVAVSDFCRRARTGASAQEVRDALSLLGEDDDFRVRELTDAEPSHQPLGPYAVVDILRGTPAEVASQRQTCGYYELVRELVAQTETPRAANDEPAPAQAQAYIARPDRPAPPPSSPPGKLSVQEKIAPKKRAPALPLEHDDDGIEEEQAASRRRNLPEPRGRYSQVAPQKQKFENLLKPEGKALLEALIQQHPNRYGLLRAVSEGYQSRAAGGRVTLEDLGALLDQHGLTEGLEARERDQLLIQYSSQRGAAGRVAWTLGLSPIELDELIKASGLSREIEEIRERFRREALNPKNLTSRLDLLGRTKYLVDLGIKKRFTDSLTADLRKLAHESLVGNTQLETALESVAQRYGTAPELLSRAVEKLGLADEFRKIAQGPAQKT